MNKNHVYRKAEVKTDTSKDIVVSKVLVKINHSNMYKIVGIVGDEYIAKTDKGLKRVKINALDNKRIGDRIRIEKL